MRALTALLVLAACALVPSARQEGDDAGLVCGLRADVVALLAEQFRERQVAAGLSESGSVVELFATRTGAKWTLLVTVPGNVSCLLASGTDLTLSPLDPGTPS
jgi:hypothetical protein